MAFTQRLRILLVGNGGREHALAWKLEQSPTVDHVFVAPGNGGTALGGKVSNAAVSASDFDALVKFALENKINLVIPGPEQPLVDGIEAPFRKHGIPVFGPSPAAAQMEGSKVFSKDFMARHNIPTAEFKTFTDYEAAVQYVHSVKHNVVIKADGLAGGKGVLLPKSKEEAVAGLQDVLVKREFGSAGDEVVVEEYLVGQELSVLAFCDGYTVKPLPLAQDHKQIGEGDTGPNTGGMGTYSPSPLEDAVLDKKIMDRILKPSLNGMRKDGMPFVGLLFVGLMISPQGEPKVLEYNVRFGDPEVQSLVSLLAPHTDLAQVMLACSERRLDFMPVDVLSDKAAVTVVLAAGGYPGSYAKGKEITIGPLPDNVMVFHAGTAVKDGKLVTAGGRVMAVTAVAENLEAAVRLAYKGVQCVSFEGMQFRKDIAHKGLGYKKAGMTYASAGVDIEAGNALVDRIKTVVKSTRRPGADADIGGFGGLFDLKATGYKDPILVSGTDGVGTKLKVAQDVGKHDTIGIDLVAMCVNDLVVQGAEPLFFLDYFACSKLDVKVTAAVVEGIAEGCRQAGCSLVGGETAEMPGLYQEGDYDLAGFSVGAVERDEVLPLTATIKAGDVVVGLGSSGVHSNGYSLVRKVVEASPLEYSSPAPWDASTTLGEELLKPTSIWMKQLLPVLRDPALKGSVKALSNITGGGWIDNIPRVLPKHLSAAIDASKFQLPPLFQWLMQTGNVDPLEMTRVFNCGVGMVLVVEASKAADVVSKLRAAGGSEVYPDFGVLTEGDGETHMIGLEAWKVQ